ncbi:MAG: CPBP family intramembrane metalloprotease [Candidatus Omnitrophica bacterium]|nr:CPBP family intramembrane metalloprotease [Candidatus Omnitrophota bacterium]
MKDNKKQLISWLFAGILGLIIFTIYFNSAFPIASIDIRLSKDEVLAKATAFIQSQGFNLEGYDQTILFDSDADASIYLQKTQGIKKSNELIKQGIPIWFWSIRWFKELDKEGFYCAVDPASGDIIYFHHALLDDAKAENLSEAQAQGLIKEKLMNMGLDLAEYELKENNSKIQKNRTDYNFEWEKKDFVIGNAHLRLSAAVYGANLGYLGRFLDVPEEFIRTLKKDMAVGQVLSIVTTIFMFFLVLAAIFVLIVQYKHDKINWKFGLLFGSLVLGLTIIDFLNNMPLLWSSYPDTISKNIFIAISAGSAFIGALLIGLIIFLFGNSGESLYQEVWKVKMPFFEAIKTKKADLAKIWPVFIVGYSLGFVFLGYITLFYLIGTRYFNIWMPPEAEYSNILSTSMPFLFPLSIALSAAVSEEFMFRLFAISFLKKYAKLTWLAILIPAMIWAFAHSNYPVFPAYVRGIELTIAGIIFGIVFLKYGLESVLIAHFVIDAALVGLPLIKSHSFYFVISGIIVIAIALFPIFILFFLGKNNLKKIK